MGKWSALGVKSIIKIGRHLAREMGLDNPAAYGSRAFFLGEKSKTKNRNGDTTEKYEKYEKSEKNTEEEKGLRERKRVVEAEIQDIAKDQEAEEAKLRDLKKDFQSK